MIRAVIGRAWLRFVPVPPKPNAIWFKRDDKPTAPVIPLEEAAEPDPSPAPQTDN